MTRRTHRNIVRFLLPVALSGALWTNACSQTSSKDPSEFDVDGVRLGMTVDEASTALQTYGFKYIAKVQFGSRLGKGPFTGAVVGMTGNEYSYAVTGDDRGDHVSVLFTETDGRAYSIDRTMIYGPQAPISWDVLRQRVLEKYGHPTPTTPGFVPGGIEFWVYDPGGRPISGPWDAKISNWSSRGALWSYCAIQGKPAANDTLFPQFFDDTNGQVLGNHGGGTGDGIYGPIPYHVAEKAGYPSMNRGDWRLYSPMMGWTPAIAGPIHAFNFQCGVTLKIDYNWSGGTPGVLVQGFQVSLFDNQRASKNMVKLIDYAKGIKTQQLEENRKKSEAQKPF